MIIKLYEAGDEIKSYNNFNSMELNAIFKDKILSSKYEIEFFGDGTEIIKTIMNDVFNDYKNVYASIFYNNYRLINNVKACKFDFMSQIFNLILFEKVKYKITYFDKHLKINIKELDIKYYVTFTK